MKNKFKSLIITLLSTLVITGCGTNKPIDSSSNEDFSSSSLSSDEPSSILDSSSILSSSSIASSSSKEEITSSEFTYDKDTRYETTKWDENVVKMISENIGDVASKIPACPADNYLAYFDTKQTIDMYENPMFVNTTRIICAELSEADVENYGALLEKNHFVYSIDSDCYYAKASATDCFYIFFHYFQKTGRLNLEIYRKTLRESKWDDEISTFIIGRKIPHIDCGAYEIYFDNINIELYIYFVDVTDAQITAYKASLVNDGWVRTSNTNELDIYSHKKDDMIKATLNEGVDAFNDKYLMVRLENAWPYYLVVASTGGDLPRSSRGTYNGFFTDKDSNENFYTQIEYENCDYEGYVSYCNALSSKLTYNYSTYEIDGDNPGSYVSSNSSLGTIYYSYYAREFKEVASGFAYVDVMYSSGLQRLIIIIWA